MRPLFEKADAQFALFLLYGETPLVAIVIRVLSRQSFYCFGNVQFADAFETVHHHLQLELQLLLIGQALKLASAALRKGRAGPGNAVWRVLNSVDDTCHTESGSDLDHLSENPVPLDARGDKKRIAVMMANAISA